MVDKENYEIRYLSISFSNNQCIIPLAGLQNESVLLVYMSTCASVCKLPLVGVSNQ
ncbi:hypothetical protein SLEP1_g18947 [Rubroshorea leprosula]|uniref:Uncharacterized protein n=1 Tax=Rubroshorea leprosula TaxID=152421 RepID=A0AAV5IZ52_9ROSI|nr:hypothetical protein SLEP1_g18947 [Rubroshorea leprosula]